MTPNLQIRYSLPYLKVLFEGYGHEAGDLTFDEVVGRTKKWGNNFKEFLREREEKVFEILPKVTGYDWDEKNHAYIPLYLVYPFPKMPSFSNPLTVKVREDPIVTFGIFLHELAHINIAAMIESSELRECIMTSAAIRVMELLSLNTSSTLELLGSIYKHRFNKDLEIIENIRTQTVKEYFI